MASIKQVAERKYKITISNGYRTDGRKICKAKTIQVPDSVPKRGVEQYVYHEAERLERLFKQGYSEDAEMTFETYARGWLDRQTKYAPGTLAFLPAFARNGIPGDRRDQAEQAASHSTGKPVGEAPQADLPRQADQGKDGAEIPDRRVRCSQRCEAQRDHRKESSAHDRPARCRTQSAGNSDDGGNAEIPVCPLL